MQIINEPKNMTLLVERGDETVSAIIKDFWIAKDFGEVLNLTGGEMLVSDANKVLPDNEFAVKLLYHELEYQADNFKTLSESQEAQLGGVGPVFMEIAEQIKQLLEAPELNEIQINVIHK